MSALTVRVQDLGQRKPLLPDWHWPLPPEQGGGGATTLRDLITRLVREQVAAFRQRQSEQRFIRILTARQIEEGVDCGRVSPGGRNLAQPVDEEASVAAALQAFEDGLYLVILDGAEQRELDREVWLRPDSELVFLRLTMLSGA